MPRATRCKPRNARSASPSRHGAPQIKATPVARAFIMAHIKDPRDDVRNAPAAVTGSAMNASNRPRLYLSRRYPLNPKTTIHATMMKLAYRPGLTNTALGRYAIAPLIGDTRYRVPIPRRSSASIAGFKKLDPRMD